MGPPLIASGTPQFFGSLGVTMGVVFMAMAVVKGHIEKNKPISASH
jgi:hypothetical protein